jgi:glycosyltransferase involved in cell wall biosynthesis
VTRGRAEELPLVSVVTPSLNQGRFVEEAIVSVRDQDYPRIEHIVVDGGSTDDTLEVLRRHPHLRWLSERDSGQADALNKGFAMAGGSVFGWLNADDLYLPGAVRLAVEALRESGAGLVYGGYRVLREDGSTAFDLPAHPFDYPALLEEKNYVPQPSAFFLREAFEAVSGLDPRYHYGLDYDLWLRIAQRFDVTVVDELLSCFRFHPEAKSGKEADRFFPELHRISRRNGGRFFSPMYVHRLPERRPWLFRALLLARLVRRRDLAGAASAVSRALSRGGRSRRRARARRRAR